MDAGKVIEHIATAFRGRYRKEIGVSLEKVGNVFDLADRGLISAQEAAANADGSKSFLLGDTIDVIEDAHRLIEDVERKIFSKLFGPAAIRAVFERECKVRWSNEVRPYPLSKRGAFDIALE